MAGRHGAATLTESAGTLTGTDSLNVSGLTTWTGGTIAGSGVLNAQGGLVLGGTDVSSYYSMILDQRTFHNAGAARFQRSASGGGYYSILYLSSGATVDNQAAASFDFTDDNLYIRGNGGTPSGGTFANEGTLTKSTGPGTSYIDNGVALNQSSSGSVASLSGTLQLNSGGTIAGTVEAMGGGSFVMTTPPTNLSGGALSGATWIVGANSSMSLGANITTDAATIILNGTGANFTSLAPLSTIASGGSLEILNGGAFTTAANLDNAGTIDLAPGTLNINGNYTQESPTGAYDVAIGGLAAGTQFGQLNVTKQASLNGALSVSLINGYTPPSGDSYRILTFGTRSGDFSAEFGLYFAAGEGFVPTYDSSGLNLVVTPEQAGTTTTITSSLNPSNYGQSVTFTATVASTIPTSLTPTGTVTFFDGATQIGSAPVNQGLAAYTTSILTAGSHSIVAEYSGDSDFSGSNSAALPDVVNQDASTTVTTPSVNPTVWGQSVTFTATVGSAVPGAGTPTGQVTFYDGTTAIDTQTLVNGGASYTTSTLPVGGHSITANYGGDTDFNGSRSTAFTQVVNQASTATGLASSVDPSVYGQSVTFTAAVTASAPGSGTPAGQVTFYDGTTAIDTATLSSGSATFETSALAVGGHSITAQYAVSTDFAGSTSAAVTQTVNRDASTTAVASSANPSIYGQPVTFTTTLSAAAPGSGTPTGTVTFYDGNQPIDTETLAAGTAKFTTSALSLGGHAIGAIYGSDPDFTGSTSATITETIKQASTTSAVTSSVDPVRLRPVGDVHGDGLRHAAGDGHADRPGCLLRRHDRDRHRDPRERHGNLHHLGPGRRRSFDHDSVQRRHRIHRQHLNRHHADGRPGEHHDGRHVVAESVEFRRFGDVHGDGVGQSPGGGTPTGAVTFYDGTSAIDTETLVGGTASSTTSSPHGRRALHHGPIHRHHRLRRQHVHSPHPDGQRIRASDPRRRGLQRSQRQRDTRCWRGAFGLDRQPHEWVHDGRHRRDRLDRRLYFRERLPRLVHDRGRRNVGLRPDRAGIGQSARDRAGRTDRQRPELRRVPDGHGQRRGLRRRQRQRDPPTERPRPFGLDRQPARQLQPGRPDRRDRHQW